MFHDIRILFVNVGLDLTLPAVKAYHKLGLALCWVWLMEEITVQVVSAPSFEWIWLIIKTTPTTYCPSTSMSLTSHRNFVQKHRMYFTSYEAIMPLPSRTVPIIHVKPQINAIEKSMAIPYPATQPNLYFPASNPSLAEASLLILDRNITARRTLILSTNEVGDLLVLGLLDGRLVVLRARAHKFLLDKVDSWSSLSAVLHKIPTLAPAV